MKMEVLKKNTLGLIVSIFLITSISSSIVIANSIEIDNTGIKKLIFFDDLDQSQTYYDTYIEMSSDLYAAQSFVPQQDILTRIELYLAKDPEYPPSEILQIGIRESLTGDNLVYSSISAGQAPSYPSIEWIEIDFDDISVTPGETYYIVSYTEDEFSYIWGAGSGDPYPNGGMYFSMDGGTTWNEFPGLDTCFKTYGSAIEGPDLSCGGSLSWNDVQAGATVDGSFTVENIGEAGSLLDWEIESYPNWGEWTFDPESGEDLTPEDGGVTVSVEVIAPDDQNSDFTGEVKIVNSENSADFCIIDVSLSTPVNQQISHPFINWIFNRFPHAFPILKLFLGY